MRPTPHPVNFAAPDLLKDIARQAIRKIGLPALVRLLEEQGFIQPYQVISKNESTPSESTSSEGLASMNELGDIAAVAPFAQLAPATPATPL